MSYDRKAMNIAAWVQRRDQAIVDAKEQLDAITGPVARAVLDFHRPIEMAHGDECHGCPPSGEYSDDHEIWPCDTTKLIADLHGVTLPPQRGWANDPDFDPFIEDPTLTEKENHHG